MLRRILEEVLRFGENALKVTHGAEMVCFALLGLLAAGFLLSFMRLLLKKRPKESQDLAFAMDKNRGVVAGFRAYAKIVAVLSAAVTVLDYTGAKTVFFSYAAALAFTGAAVMAVLVFEGVLLLICNLKNKNLRFIYKVARAGEERRLQSLRAALKSTAIANGRGAAGIGNEDCNVPRAGSFARGNGNEAPEIRETRGANAGENKTGANARENVAPIDPLSVVARYWSCDRKNAGGSPEFSAAGALRGDRRAEQIGQDAPDFGRAEVKSDGYIPEAIVPDPIRSPVPGVPAPGVTEPGLPGVPPADVPDRGLPGSIPAEAPKPPMTEPGVAPSPVVEPKTGAEIVGRNPQAPAEKVTGENAAFSTDIPGPVFYGAAISKEKVEELLRRAGNLPLSETDAFHVKKIELSLKDAMSSGCPADAMSSLLSALVKVIARYEAA